MLSDFLNLYLYKQTNVENISYSLYIASIVISPLLDIFPLMHSWFILQSWSKLVHYQTLLVHAKQAITETNPKSSTHVSSAICQICLLSHDAMISHNIEVISMHCCLLLELDCLRNLPIQQYTIWPFVSTLCGIPSRLPTCWTLDILVNTQSTNICCTLYQPNLGHGNYTCCHHFLVLQHNPCCHTRYAWQYIVLQHTFIVVGAPFPTTWATCHHKVQQRLGRCISCCCHTNNRSKTLCWNV
jgi:hypothetical protein